MLHFTLSARGYANFKHFSEHRCAGAHFCSFRGFGTMFFKGHETSDNEIVFRSWYYSMFNPYFNTISKGLTKSHERRM